MQDLLQTKLCLCHTNAHTTRALISSDRPHHTFAVLQRGAQIWSQFHQYSRERSLLYKSTVNLDPEKVA